MTDLSTYRFMLWLDRELMRGETDALFGVSVNTGPRGTIVWAARAAGSLEEAVALAIADTETVTGLRSVESWNAGTAGNAGYDRALDEFIREKTAKAADNPTVLTEELGLYDQDRKP